MLTEYQTHTELNPVLWKNNEIPSKVRMQLLKIANYFYKFLDVDAKILDVILTGSSVNYNWTTQSDIDLHVLLDYTDIDENEELVRKLMSAKKSIWNQQYPIKLRQADIELYAQDVNEPHAATGIYSLMQDRWIRKPEPTNIAIPDTVIQDKAQPYADMINALSATDPAVLDTIAQLQTKIKKFRKCGLDTAGEYSLENLAFKWLRDNGYLDKLSDIRDQVMMSDMQITENNDQQPIVAMLRNHMHSSQKMTATDWKFLMRHLDTIVDPQGQWAHPGRCTLIPAADITMQNVAYPVFGVDETGHWHIMQPEQTYRYPGTFVFEIPLNQPHYVKLINQLT
jgi:hypothetical protein